MIAYFGLIFPVRNNTHKLLKYFPQIKDCPALHAKDNKEFLRAFDSIKDELTKTKIKGAQELLSILASGIILTMITPQLVNKIVHPVMKKFDENKLDKNA